MSRHRAEAARNRKVLVGAAVLAVTCVGSITAVELSSGAASAASANLVADPGFSSGVAAWTTAAGGSLSIVDGHDGHRAIRLLNTTGHPLTLALNDRLNTVAKTQAGAVYEASAWVSTDAPGISSAVRMMEYAGSVNHGGNLASTWMRTTSWTQVSVKYTAATSNSSLDLNVLAWALPQSKSLLISDPSMVELSAPAGPAPIARPTTPAPTSAAPITAAPTTAAPTTPAPTTAAPTTAAPTTAAPTTAAPTSAAPTTAAPTTAAPTTAAPSTPAPTATAPAGFRLVWSDEFSSLNQAKWNVRNNTWSSNEESIDTSRPENVFVNGGDLTLRAIKQTYKVGGTTRQYTSGYLDTIGKASWQYGRIEMRAKLPAAQGMWPAFWLRDNAGLGELDIMEAVGGMSPRTVQTVHQSTNGNMARAGHEDVLPSGSSSDWHTYAVDREPGTMKWYVDNRLVFSQSTVTLPWLDSAFNQPMNIRLNLQVGGSMPAYYKKPVVTAPAGASDYVIDYVRVYQH